MNHWRAVSVPIIIIRANSPFQTPENAKFYKNESKCFPAQFAIRECENKILRKAESFVSAILASHINNFSWCKKNTLQLQAELPS